MVTEALRCPEFTGITSVAPVLYCAGRRCQPGRVRPTIGYCPTPAGRIAHSVAGAGPALLCDSGWITHLRRQLELNSFGGFVEGLPERFTVIRYDKPGRGLSDRDGIGPLIRRAGGRGAGGGQCGGSDRFCLFGALQGGQLAAAIAAKYADRVEAPVLHGTCAQWPCFWVPGNA
jgi:pimeloyl-ACP methyl ester carboxylesterase